MTFLFDSLIVLVINLILEMFQVVEDFSYGLLKEIVIWEIIWDWKYDRKYDIILELLLLKLQLFSIEFIHHLASSLLLPPQLSLTKVSILL